MTGPGPWWAGLCRPSLRLRPPGPAAAAVAPRACPVTEGCPGWGPPCRGVPAPSTDSAAGQGLVPPPEASPRPRPHTPAAVDPRRRRLKGWQGSQRDGAGVEAVRGGWAREGDGGREPPPPGRCAGGTAGADGERPLRLAAGFAPQRRFSAAEVAVVLSGQGWGCWCPGISQLGGFRGVLDS